MRAASAGSVGLWSTVKSYACTASPALRPSTARLSPTHAVISLVPRSTLSVSVAPDSEQSTCGADTRWSFVCAKASHSRPSTSMSFTSRCASSSVRCFAAMRATMCPTRRDSFAHIPLYICKVHDHAVDCLARSMLVVSGKVLCNFAPKALGIVQQCDVHEQRMSVDKP